ncbi:hypothetical protein [Leptospira sp. GIMC2001]|uniref:hypothetical protein n=1 Tax=Leptospira sp. GIMC2001 TaxID=1513297 RepID=UPI00234A1EB4|nr:hypothetical protein [Leptospira sp. GIMC2001]WCL51514.1 hypothetical protein O4O04_20065 [Leptospira sp. GIMC2001]
MEKEKTFKEKLQEFVKSMAGGDPTPPPPAPEGGKGESEITEEVLTNLQKALEAGEIIPVEEASVRTWCETQKLSPEACTVVWENLSQSLGDQGAQPPADTPPAEPTQPIQKGGDKGEEFPELKEFAKSLSAYQADQATIEKALAGILDQNSAMKKQLEVIPQLTAQVEFLKSQMGILAKTPVGPKTPAIGAGDIPNEPGKAEIKKVLYKAVEDKQIALADFMTFNSKGVQTDAVKLFLKSQGGNI